MKKDLKGEKFRNKALQQIKNVNQLILDQFQKIQVESDIESDDIQLLDDFEKMGHQEPNEEGTGRISIKKNFNTIGIINLSLERSLNINDMAMKIKFQFCFKQIHFIEDFQKSIQQRQEKNKKLAQNDCIKQWINKYLGLKTTILNLNLALYYERQSFYIEELKLKKKYKLKRNKLEIIDVFSIFDVLQLLHQIVFFFKKDIFKKIFNIMYSGEGIDKFNNHSVYWNQDNRFKIIIKKKHCHQQNLSYIISLKIFHFIFLFSENILQTRTIIQVKPKHICSLIAIIDQDIFDPLQPDSNILGRACGDGVCVVQFQKDQKVFYGTIIHELMHTLGFDHCYLWNCLMNENVDFSELHLCVNDLEKLCMINNYNKVKRYKSLLNYYKKAGFQEEYKWIQKMIAIFEQ